MRPASWAWSRTEPRLGRLYLLLAAVGVALLAVLTWVLWPVAPQGDAQPLRFDEAEVCTESPRATEHRRAGLAGLLQAAAAADRHCQAVVPLPAIQPPASFIMPPGDAAVARAWFRVTYPVPAALPAGEALTVYVPRVMGLAWQLRVDGRALADNLDDWRMTWNRPLAVRLTPGQFRAGQILEIEFVLAYVPQLGHALARPLVGASSAVEPRWRQRELLQSIMPLSCSLVLLMLGAFFLAFWWVRRAEKSHLLIALAGVAWSVCNLQYALPRHDDPTLERWYNSIVIVAVTWFMWLVYLFALRFDTRRLRWVELALPLYVLVTTFAVLPLWPLLDDEGLTFLIINDAFAAAVTLLIAYLAVRGGSFELRVIALSLLIALAAGTHDIALFAGRVDPESIYLLPYAGVLVFGGFLLAIQRRYMQAIEDHAALTRTQAERLAAQEAALTASHARLREFEQAQTLAAERERLTRDIHDGLGAALTSSLIAVERGHSSPGDVAAMLRDCIDELRVVVDSLEPGEHDLLSLLASLRFRLERRLAAAGVQLDWQIGDLPPIPWLGPPEALHLLRIVQEMLVNALKHAHARRIAVITASDDECVRLRCVDDGCGFDLATVSAGRGLPSMRQRCAILGAEIEMRSVVGRGTEIGLSLPLVRRREASQARRNSGLAS